MSKVDHPVSLERRHFFKTAAVAGGASIAATLPGRVDAKDPPSSPPTTPFIVPLPVSRPKLPLRALKRAPTEYADDDECGRDDHQGFKQYPPKRFYEIEVKEASHSFHPQYPTQKVWGYDGVVPGPTIVARYGEPILLRVYNKLPKDHVGFGSPEISTHLHNAHTPSESDGFAGDYYSDDITGPTLTRPGKYRDHHYPNIYAGGDSREALGTLWYHDHRMDFTAPNGYRGLAGFYLLFDELDSGDENDLNPKALRLPSGVGVHDIPLVFQDRTFDSRGYLTFDQFNTDGVIGDKFLVNGKIQPFFSVARRKYRFRLLDGGPSRFYEFYLVHNNVDQAFTYIANDGNLLEAPLTMTKLRMGVAERADIIIDFSKYTIGSKLYLVNRLNQTDGRGPDGVSRTGTQILRFDVDREPDLPDNSRIPTKLRELPPIDRSKIKNVRQWKFDRLAGYWTVNEKVFDVARAQAIVKRGTAEEWVLETSGNWSHPVHIHFEEFRILSRNGAPPPAHERGRKDVIVLSPGETARIFIQFRDFKGKYIMHCHNTLHEDHAMMVRWDIE